MYSRDSSGGSSHIIPSKLGENNQRPMGFVCGKGRLQTRVSKHTSIFGYKKDVCSKSFTSIYNRRNKFFVTKRCGGKSRPPRSPSRFLQYLLHGSKKIRGNETCSKSQTIKQLSKKETFQNGYSGNGHKSSEAKRLGNYNRFDRCLSTYPNISKASKISKILLPGAVLSVEGDVFRTDVCSTSIHETSGSSCCLLENSKFKTSSVLRRLDGSESSKINAYKRPSVLPQSVDFTRVCDQSKEVQFDPTTIDCLHRCSISVESQSSDTDGRTVSQDDTDVTKFCRRESQSTNLFEASWSNGILHRIDTQCPSIHETYTNSSSQFLEPNQTVFGCRNSCYSTSNFSSKMVEKSSQHFQGQIFNTGNGKYDHNYGCLKNNVWGSSGESICSGQVVRGSEKESYQLVRNGSSQLDNQTFLKLSEGEQSSHQVGQHDCGSIYKQTRGNAFHSTMSENLGSLEFGNSEQHVSQSSTYLWKDECFGRSVESNSNSSNRMDFESRDSPENLCSMGHSIDRSICVGGQLSDSNILQLVPEQTSFCDRCSVNFMGEHVCVCISSDLPDSKDSETFYAVPLSDDFDSAKMAKETILYGPVTTASSMSIETSSEGRPVSTTQVIDTTSQSRVVSVDSMDVIDRQFSEKGFSKETRDLLRAAWRKGTQKDYNSKFRIYDSWCSERKIDSLNPSLVNVTQFLTSRYEKGLQYRTIAGYRSMLSTVLPPIDGFKVGQHPVILQLIKGTFNARPPQRKLLPEWDLNKVLKALQESPFEPLRKSSLKILTYKTVFLIAITCFRRCSDIQSLQIGQGSVNVQSNGITFRRPGLSKQDRQSHYGASIFIPAFSENKHLDPKRCLYYYLKRTEKFRKHGDGTEEDQLFLGINEPHKPVAVQTISNWLVQTIKLALDKKDLKVKAHSTRAIGPSYALYRGASVNSILSAADWSRESTFIRFYLRNIPCEVLGK